MPELAVVARSGRLEGTATPDGAVRIYRGIPYAAPPVGNLRWRAPQPLAPWQGVRPAKEFGPRCIQPSRHETSIGYFGPATESEDCLYLNIWTPARGRNDAPRPVMVWIHGGAFVLGSGSLPIFDGERLARAGVVLVTVNFRLGRLGYLAHPDLSRESGQRSSGNYGMLDQIAALRWIGENIAAFGGDAGRVTVFGQSTGSVSVSLLMASPLAQGLFHGAIGQSGARVAPPSATSTTGGTMQTLDAAERSGVEFARALGANSAAELRSLPAAELQLARLMEAGAAGAAPAPNRPTDTAFPIVDGYFLPDSPHAILAQGRQNHVPLLTGSNENEGATMPGAASLSHFLGASRSDFGDLYPKFLEMFPAETDAQAVDASRTAFGYRSFVWQNWTWARMHARRSQAYYYRFARVPPVPSAVDFLENAAEKLGAFHGAEIPYVFRNLCARSWPWTQVDRRLSLLMSSYWLNFAANGDPNGDGLPDWSAFVPESTQAMVLGDDVGMASIADAGRLEFWDAHYSRAQRGG